MRTGMRNETSKGSGQRHVAPLLAVLILFVGRAFGQDIPKIAREDKIRIKEAFHLLRDIGDEVWPGWSGVRIPVVFVDKDFEYLIGHPKPGKDFVLIENDAYLGATIHSQKRTTMPNIAAAYPVGEDPLPAVLIGSAANLDDRSSSWVLTVIHEMFHVLEQNRGQFEKVKALKLGSETDASWMLEYPFPYDDLGVRALASQMIYSLWRCLASNDDLEFELQSYSDLRNAFRELLKSKYGTENHYNYCKFQEWNEGAARYTERAVLRKIAEKKYRPLPEFEQLMDYAPFETLRAGSPADAPENLKAILESIRKNFNRVDFYTLGAAQAELLDNVDGRWKERFFHEGVWLDDLVLEGLDRLKSLVGKPAPSFELKSVSGETVRLKDFAGKPVLLFFMSSASWATPVLRMLPDVNTFCREFKDRGLTVLGVLLQSKEKETESFLKERAPAFPLLIGTEPAFSFSQHPAIKPYRMSTVPGVVLIDRGGKVVFHQASVVDPQVLRRELKKIVD